LNLPFFPPQQHFQPTTKHLPILGLSTNTIYPLLIMELKKTRRKNINTQERIDGVGINEDITCI
jgi:hypothetical protein